MDQGRHDDDSTWNNQYQSIEIWQNGQNYIANVDSSGNSSVFQLEGVANEAGFYVCRNSLGETYRQFAVTIDEPIQSISLPTLITLIASAILLVLVVLAVLIGVKCYVKVNTGVTLTLNSIQSRYVNVISLE